MSQPILQQQVECGWAPCCNYQEVGKGDIIPQLSAPACRRAPCRNYQEVGGCGIIPSLYLCYIPLDHSRQDGRPPHRIPRLDESSRMAGGPCPRNGGVWHCNIIWGIQDEGLRSNMADMELGDPWDYPTIWRPSLPRPRSIASPGWMSHPRWWAIRGSYPWDCIVRHCNIVWGIQDEC